ncbi:MAG: peptidyl-tRNA hydrolase, family [Candidatus Krumholzibacteriota bacterium]|nr:peptidyl-tRNA hydrolase, family [Candidatus Krumholzibacteriota bacterium]
MSPNFIVVGLGNPGPRYASTRHNLGFRVVDRLAADHGGYRWEDRGTSLIARVALDLRDVLLVKPLTYMNLSGRALSDLPVEGEPSAQEILVVVDDIALPLGQIRLRRRGSDGGHNGLKSIIAELGSADFPRIRLGVGPVPPGWDAAEFVLGAFERGEESAVRDMVERAARCVEAVFEGGLDRAMGEFNAPSVEGENG